jgi:nucleoside-diphosphate-sugar epimerase
MQTSLVIGGAGFIGSHLVDELVRRKHKVVVIDNLSSGYMSNIKGHIEKEAISAYFVDMRSEACANIIRDVKPNNIFLLAAIPGVPVSVEKPIRTNDVNVNGCLNVLNAARGNCDRIIFSSSSSIYGGSEVLPTPEYEKENCKSPYALQKLTIERYLQLYSSLYNIDTVSLRYFNIFGPRQYPKSAYAAVISAFCKSLKESTPAVVYGDGEQFRDFTYVSNAVHANILAAEYNGELNGEVFNVGCGQKCSVNDLARAMELTRCRVQRGQSRRRKVLKGRYY